mmetsp:Transcript_17602/g.30804  ORF Transcript_17602/g.30804 Transcript_17602/m.30804 type:complete len:175 (+) Transcript_17602:40-564(+)
MFRKSINKLVVINQCSKTSLNSCRRRQQMPTLNLTQQRSFADGASPVSGKFRKKDKGKKGKTDDEDGDRVAFANEALKLRNTIVKLNRTDADREKEKRIHEVYMKEHGKRCLELQKRMTATLKAKAYAMTELPHEFRDAAWEDDVEPLPWDFQLPTDTPPVEGYDPLGNYQDTS